jgi:acetyltransferase
MRTLFEPRSVAIIGASLDTEKIGHRIVANLVESGYSGEIVPINPKGGTLFDRPIRTDLDELQQAPDLAVIAIPAAHVLDAVDRCGRGGVKHAIIITSGFAEIGREDAEREIVARAREHGLRILGPNVFGIFSAAASMDATFGPGGILPGRVAIITQSGALGIAMIGRTAAESLGLSALVSVGNKSDIDEADLLSYLAFDAATRVVLLYIEGVRNGEKLLDTLRAVVPQRHVIVIKSGRSERGAQAAASHTGSLAGADEVFDDLMRQCGVLRATSIEEAFDWSHYLAHAPMPAGEGAVIVTNGGGIGVLATDACERYRISLFDDQPALQEAMGDAVPEFGSAHNPVDITGQANADAYEKALGSLADHPRMHAAIALYCETGLFDVDAFSQLLRRLWHRMRNRKPLIVSLFGGSSVDSVIRELRREGLPVFSDVYDAVASLGALYASWRARNREAEEIPAEEIDIEEVRGIVQGALDDGRNALIGEEIHRLASLLGLTIPSSLIARNLEEAIAGAEQIGYPVVLKIVSKDILHRSDAGGVALDLEDERELIDGYQAVLRQSRSNVPGASIAGVEVAEMVPSGLETIVGARQDPSFGPVVMFGLGGIYVEVIKDVTFRAAPVSRRVVQQMISDVQAYPLLLGVRGEEPKDIEAIVPVVVRLGTIIQAVREISDIEVNPLVVYDQGAGVKALDVRVLLRSSER